MRVSSYFAGWQSKRPHVTRAKGFPFVKQRRSGNPPGLQVKSLKLQQHWEETGGSPSVPIRTLLLSLSSSDAQWLRCDWRRGHAFVPTHTVHGHTGALCPSTGVVPYWGRAEGPFQPIPRRGRLRGVNIWDRSGYPPHKKSAHRCINARRGSSRSLRL